MGFRIQHNGTYSEREVYHRANHPAVPIENPQLLFLRYDDEQTLLLPYYHDGVHCTSRFPSACTDYMEEVIDLVAELAPNPDYTFFARAKGNSMERDGIVQGDVLVLDKSEIRKELNKQLLVWWGNENTYVAKRYQKINGSEYLVSASFEHHPPIPLDETMFLWARIRCIIHFP